MVLLRLGLLSLLVLGCSKTAKSNDQSDPAEGSSQAAGSSPSEMSTERHPQTTGFERGGVLVEHFECGRCHAANGLTQVPQSKHCVSCHEAIHAGAFVAPPAALGRWKHNIVNLREVPDLDASLPRLRADWVIDFLTNPVDVRPHLGATMPRFRMTRTQARDIVEYLFGKQVVERSVPELSNTAGDLALGKALYTKKQCASCHEPAASNPPPNVSERAFRLAPNLELTKTRMTNALTVTWLLEPKRFAPATLMPNHGLSQNEAEALASYLFSNEFGAAEAKQAPERLPLLNRPVVYADVEKAVFRKVCWHCHSQPDLLRGDGGPGMTGGFGFSPRYLDLSTYSAVLGGYEDKLGRPASVFQRQAEFGEPMLVAVLLARQREQLGESRELRGMPLGLPALSAEQIQLVETWIAQGRPQ